MNAVFTFLFPLFEKALFLWLFVVLPLRHVSVRLPVPSNRFDGWRPGPGRFHHESIHRTKPGRHFPSVDKTSYAHHAMVACHADLIETAQSTGGLILRPLVGGSFFCLNQWDIPPRAHRHKTHQSVEWIV